MTTLEILKAARALIADPKRWTQGESARDATGRSVPSRHSNAVCWCAIGALNRVADIEKDDYTAARHALSAATNGGIAHTNDTTDHPTVLRAFDAAIERAAATGGQS